MVKIQHPTEEIKEEKQKQPTDEKLERELLRQTRDLIEFARNPRPGDDEVSFKAFELSLRTHIFAMARTAILLFLTCAERRVHAQTQTWVQHGERTFQRTRQRSREITTWFGRVRYWRTYMLERQVEKGQQGRGYFPLDIVLGLTSDRFSLNVFSVVVRLSIKLSFAEAKSTSELFLPTVPSTKVIEKATLGFGKFTNEWFELSEAPEGDGDVLVILVDSKGVAQVTEEEMIRRKRPWKDRPRAASPRHRGRNKRGRHGSKKRRKKGDKTKNAKMATLVVMYTLRSVGMELQGPINKWVYASFAPKKHAFAIAFREAQKRGFAPDGKKVIQVVTDGDEDLARYTKLFFPKAKHTLDVIHVVEKLWEAGGLLYTEGSEELSSWVEIQKDHLYGGEVELVIKELRNQRNALCRSKKNKKKRKRLKEIINYLAKRISQMNYAELIDEDFEIGSGAVEGAVKYIIGKRCDQGGMRWCAERCEAIIQLRCIEANGHWEQFFEHVHQRVYFQQKDSETHFVVQSNSPGELPDLLEPIEWRKAS